VRGISFTLFLVILLSLPACSPKDTTTATISVTFGNPPTVNTNDYFVDSEAAEMKSYAFLRHTSESLELPEKWKLSEDEVVAKLRHAISVRAGNESGQLVITARGLDHQTAVNIINELCNFQASQEIWGSENGGALRKEHVTVVQPAK
jgi:capsular polysaccharide biosynthesis protein